MRKFYAAWRVILAKNADPHGFDKVFHIFHTLPVMLFLL